MFTIRPEWVFTMRQNQCSPSARMGVHDQTEYALIKDKYFDLNLLHLAEQLAENENIIVKRETLRGWAHDIHQNADAATCESAESVWERQA